jgi:hypothetical protein
LQNGKASRWTLPEMMTKKRNSAIYIFLLILFFVPPACLSGTDNSAPAVSTASTDWTIAAEKFTLTQKEEVSQSAAAELLPKLILEQLAENLERMPSAREQLDQKLYDLQKKRLDLFLQLSKEVQVRDSLVLGNYSERALGLQIKSEDEKIAEIKKEIEENLAQQAEEEKKSQPDIDRDVEREKDIDEGKVLDDDLGAGEKNDAARFKEILKGFVPGKKQELSHRNIKLYKNDFTQLFDAGTAAGAGHDSREFEDAVISAGINALVTGRISIYGGYVSATVSLIVYPGMKTAGTVTDVSSVSDFRLLAVSIARQLTPKITNSMPVELTFDIMPQEAADNIVLTIDDVVYKVIPDHLIVQSGVHSVMFSSPGFKQISTSYAFRGSRAFKISVELMRNNSGIILLRLKKPLMGTMYANGSKTGQVDEEYPVTKIEINNQPILGQFIAEDGTAASFYVPQELTQNGTTLMVNAKPFDRSKYIDIRRRWMYGSYSALIISLMGSFYTYGTFYADYLGYQNGYVNYADVAGWQQASHICTGISIGCGVFFTYELVRYFLAANKVLPDRAYVSKYDIAMPAEEQKDAAQPEITEKPSAGSESDNKVEKK